MRNSGRGSDTSTVSARSSPEDYGQGWTQLTDHGKIYLSKKEKNVFIIEGTKKLGFSACAYGGTLEQRQSVESGEYCVTTELKCVPCQGCQGQQVFIVLDCFGMSDLTSGCDFCGVKLCFDTHELRVESHRKNASAQTLYVQPNCAVLYPSSYVTVMAVVHGDTFSLALDGVSIVSNLSTGRARQGGDGGPRPQLGIAVYGQSRCYLRRFRVSPAPPNASEGAQQQQQQQLAICGGASPAMGRARSVGAGGGAPVFAPRRTMTGGLEAPLGGGGGCINGGPNSASEDLELAAAIERDIVVADLHVRFEDIGGLDDAKRAINEAVVLPLILPEFFTGLRKPWKGVLLFGPPGTGKTMLAKAAASCTENITFFNCSAATLTSKWRGESEKLLRALFVTARARVPSILFFDEIDSLLSHRGSSAEHEASRRFKSEFLIHMDGLLSDARPEGEQVGHLLVLATSNAPWDLDEALKRRLEKRIYIPLPDVQARRRMFEHHLKDIPTSEDVDMALLAERTEGYSGADVQLVCRDASMNPMRRMIEGKSPAELVQLRDEGGLTPGSAPVEASDLEAALSNVQPSVGAGDTVRYMEWARDFGSK